MREKYIIFIWAIFSKAYVNNLTQSILIRDKNQEIYIYNPFFI